MKKTNKKKESMSVADTVKAIRAKFGDDSIMKMDQKPLVGVEAISTGSFGLDLAIGIGGLPRGRMVEIFGPESSGKTTIALQVVAAAQKMGDTCAYIDAEHAMDPEYAKKLGVNTSELFISQPQSGEQALEILESMVRSGNWGVVVIDSVAALTPQAEIEGEMGAAQMGRHARLMSHALRKLVSVVAESNTLVLFINQIRTSLNVFPGSNPEYTPGGKALKFFASVRVDLRCVAKIKKGEDVMGSRVKAKVIKNKVAPPFRQTEFDVMYGEGVSFEGELLALGEKVGVVEKSSASAYSAFGESFGRGYETARQFLKSNPVISSRIKDAIVLKVNSKVETVQAEVTNQE